MLVVSRDSVTVHGAPASFTVEADSGASVSRLFCQRCGSPLFATNVSAPTLLAIKAATLDDPSWLQPAAHIWTRSAPAWACRADALMSFAENFGAT